MNLLGAALYDPSVAVSKATSSLLALTVVDTTNLRLAITVPAHGMVRFKMRCLITGATTVPTVLLGVLNGATVLGRVTPTYENATANATTQSFVSDAEFTVTGLTPGAMNVDAAYAVQVVVASTNIKYGGPNNASGANAWGGFLFEAWDPRPMPTASPGAASGLLIAGSNAATTFASVTSTGAFSVNGVSAVSQTGDAYARLGAPAGASVSADVAAVKSDTGSVKVQTDKLVFTVAGYLDVNAYKWVGGTIPAVNVAGVPLVDLKYVLGTISPAAAGSVRADSVTGSVGSVTGNVAGSVASVTGGVTLAASQHVIVDSGTITNLPAIPTGWITAAGITAGALSGKGDWLLASGYSTPPSAAAIRAEIDTNSVGLAAIYARTDVATSTRLATASYTAPDNTSIAAIKIKTDSHQFSVAGKLDVNVKSINDVTLTGAGTANSRWQP